MANNCKICGKELTILTGRVKFCDGYICTSCLTKNKVDKSMNALLEYQKISFNTVVAKIERANNDAESYKSFIPEKVIELSTSRSLINYEEI